MRETALPEADLKTARSKILIACTINLVAVSTVFMTQSIFLGPVWRSYGWHGITTFCSFSLLISLLIMSVIALKERDIKGGD